MTAKDQKSIQVSEQEMVSQQDMERTRERQCFVPKTDIFETDRDIILVADMPGVSGDSVDITLEKDILSIEANSEPREYEGLSVSYSEYLPGDFRRQFRITEEIDREKIDATVIDGVLRLTLPKAESAKVKKIPVKAG